MRKPFNGNYVVTQPFGANPRVYGPGGHRGIDYGLPGKTPVIAMEAGVVKKMPFQWGGFGNYLTLTFGPYIAYYGHLHSITKTGVVKEGDVIGYSDSSGWSTGNHLHLEIYNRGSLINPNSLFTPPAPAPTLRRLTVIATAGANIRREPTTASAVVTRVPFNTILWARSRANGQSVYGNPVWFRVNNGWISATTVR